MFSLWVECAAWEKDILVSTLWEKGTTGIVERDVPPDRCELEAFFEQKIPLEIPNSRWQEEPQKDWVQVSRECWEPMLVGRRFFLVPEWRNEPAPEGRLRLEIRPGMAAGTGRHPATRLCLEALERYVTPGACVFDVGTGSGILAKAAVLLGAGRVLACDADPEAAGAASENLAGSGARLFVGSPRAVTPGVVDLLVANLNAATLLTLSQDLVRSLRAGGRAILSGFTGRQVAAVQQSIESPASRLIDTLEAGEFFCLVFASTES